MDQYYYKCQYCGAEYVPNKRNRQKYCTPSCRSSAYRQRKKKTSDQLKNLESEEQRDKKEGMSLAGIGNAAAGNMVFDMLKNFLTSEENKSASRGQAQEILNLLRELKERHHLITNLPARDDGALPYYDMENQEITYRIPLHKLKVPKPPSIDSIFK